MIVLWYLDSGTPPLQTLWRDQILWCLWKWCPRSLSTAPAMGILRRHLRWRTSLDPCKHTCSAHSRSSKWVMSFRVRLYCSVYKDNNMSYSTCVPNGEIWIRVGLKRHDAKSSDSVGKGRFMPLDGVADCNQCDHCGLHQSVWISCNNPHCAGYTPGASHRDYRDSHSCCFDVAAMLQRVLVITLPIIYKYIFLSICLSSLFT